MNELVIIKGNPDFTEFPFPKKNNRYTKIFVTRLLILSSTASNGLPLP
jgi:hypothetical protein